MTSPDVLEYHGPSDGISLPADYLPTVLYVVTERRPEAIAERLYETVEGYPHVDMDQLQEGVALGDKLHAGQRRSHDNPPHGEPNKLLTTHTLGSTLLTAVLLGRRVTTINLVTSVLHDTVEDGRMFMGTPQEREVRRYDLSENLGEIGDDVGYGVAVFSRVEDVMTDNDLERMPVSDDVYIARLAGADVARPHLRLPTIKIGGDFVFNLGDPLHPKPDRIGSRERKIAEARGPVLWQVYDDPLLVQAVSATANMVERVLHTGTTVALSKHLHRPRQIA